MNFLAHLYLSGDNEEVILGNFIADSVKGSHFDRFPPDVIKGIRLHREIDSFTDNHPVFLQSKARLSATYGKYSGVIVDLYYDHFLARNWNDYSKTPIEDYVAQTYRLLLRNYSILPARPRRILPYMIAQNWLAGYAEFNKLERVFQGMARRTSFRSGMETAVDDLKKDHLAYEAEFRAFFPDIIRHAGQYRKNISVS
jgi:acyl carrier protein phosphodiesterase